MSKHLTDFKPYEVSGFSLSGWVDSDGVLELSGGTVLKEVPETITLNDVEYTLEETTSGDKKDNKTYVDLLYC